VAVAIAAVVVTLAAVFFLLYGTASLGVVISLPIVAVVGLVVGGMSLLGIPLNLLTALLMSLAIGLGVDYSAHIVHRFGDEYRKRDLYDAIEVAVRGTGGSLTGSMLTTVTGIGVLVLAITPILGQFGAVTGLSILLSYLMSVIVTPSVMVVWGQFVERRDASAA